MTPRDLPPDKLKPLLSAVAACRWRGEALPPRHQAECGCPELTRCHRGKGRLIPGVAWAVTLDECLSCVTAS